MAAAAGALAVGGLSQLLGAIFSGRAATKAADVQDQTSRYIADLQLQAQREAQALQLGTFEQEREDNEDWRQTGVGALSHLRRLMGDSAGFQQQDFAAPAPFKFDPSRLAEDPGYQFRLAEGQRALERSAAAKGSLLSGATLRRMAGLNQDMASTEYGNAYNRAGTEYDRDFSNRFTVHQANQANQGNQFNRLASVAGLGQTAVNNVSDARQQFTAAQNNNIMTTAQNVGEAAAGGANARASGYIGRGNAWTNAISNIGNNLMEFGQNRYTRGRV